MIYLHIATKSTKNVGLNLLPFSQKIIRHDGTSIVSKISPSRGPQGGSFCSAKQCGCCNTARLSGTGFLAKNLQKFKRIFQVLLKCGRQNVITQLAVYTRYRLYTNYTLPSGGLYNPYYLLPEPDEFYDVWQDLLYVTPFLWMGFKCHCQGVKTMVIHMFL